MTYLSRLDGTLGENLLDAFVFILGAELVLQSRVGSTI